MRIINHKGKTHHKSVIRNIINEQILTKKDINLKDVVIQGRHLNDGNPTSNNFIKKIKYLQQQNQMNSIFNRQEEQQGIKNTTLFKNTAIQNRLQSQRNYNNTFNVTTFRSQPHKKRYSLHPNSQDKMETTHFTIRQKTQQKYYTQSSKQQNSCLKQLSPQYRYNLQKYVNILSKKNKMINTFYCNKSPKFNQYHKYKSMNCDNRKENNTLQLSSNLLKNLSKNNTFQEQIKQTMVQQAQSNIINQKINKQQQLSIQTCQIIIKKPKIKICLSYKNQQQKQANHSLLSWKPNTPNYRKSKPNVYLTPSSIRLNKPNEFIVSQ